MNSELQRAAPDYEPCLCGFDPPHALDQSHYGRWKGREPRASGEYRELKVDVELPRKSMDIWFARGYNGTTIERARTTREGRADIGATNDGD